jgi:serine/threonine protein kinase
MPRYLSHAAYKGGKIYMVLEYAEYSIRDYLNSRDIENKLSFKEVLMQMLEAVQELHLLGYVHSQIKYEKFRIMNNRVVLIDFGCMKPYLNKDG